jgi:hypothetical protein
MTMKNKIFFVVMAMTISMSLIAGTVTTQGKIGRPSKSCTGLGVCQVQTNNNGLTMIWDYNATAQTLSLHINKDELQLEQPSAEAEFINKTQVTFEDETIIPSIVVQTFQLQESIIATGTYPLQTTQEEYIVVFSL